MIELVRGIEYNYNGMRILKGQKVRFRSDIEDYLVSTNSFQYVGARRVIYVEPNTTGPFYLKDILYTLIDRQAIGMPAEAGNDLIRLGFGKEVPVRKVIINSTELLSKALFIRNGGFGDLILLYQALNYMFSQRLELKCINLMTESRYFPLFENDNRFILHSLDDYETKAGTFEHVLDLRMSVESDHDTGTLNRTLLFIRLLGLNIRVIDIKELKENAYINMPELKTKYDDIIKDKSIVLNIATSRPERDLYRNTILELIQQLKDCDSFSNIIILNDRPFVYKDESGKVNNLAAKTTLSEMIQVVNKSKYYIGLDTGPSHLAGSLHKKGLIIGGPIDLKLRASQYTNLKIIQNNDMPCVTELTCYNCPKISNVNMPGKCMEGFTGKYLFDRLMEVIQ